MRLRPALLALGATALAVLPSLGGTAEAAAPRPQSAASASVSETVAGGAEPTDELATELLTPFALAAGADGTLYFSQALRGAVMREPADEAAYRIFRAHDHHLVGGVSVAGRHVLFTLSGDQQKFGRLMSTRLVGGKAREVADLGDYERAHNPDGSQRYGFTHLSASCAAKLPHGMSATYTGRPRTEPLATLRRGGQTYVADGAANAIWKVSDHGRIRTVAVLPGVRTRVTRAYVRQEHLPHCTLGVVYRAEATPTDVVAGPGRSLYVTTRGGGPAREGRTPRGIVWRVSGGGRLTKVATHLDTPTGVTVAPDGDLYVAELFAGQIVRIPAGTHDVVGFADPGFPGALLATPSGLLATANVLSGSSGKHGDPVNGTVLRYAY